jgi:hypothetical protein
MSNENEDVIASVIESQDGQLDTEVGQDEGTDNEESSTVDWEAQAKYHQSEKDKLYAENQQIKEKVQEFLDSRKTEQPSAPEKITLKPDEFDPWEAYNDPSSASYKFRMQEMQETVNGAVEQIRQNQANPQPAGVLQGSQPEKKSETDQMWEAVMSAGKRSNVL